MYETLLKGSRLHRKQGGAFGFYPPDAKAEHAVRELWKAIDGFLAETDTGRQSVEKLFDAAAAAAVRPERRRAARAPCRGACPRPFAGGPVRGRLVRPAPNAAVFERIFRSPGKFELQRFRIAGPRAEVFQQYAAMLTRTDGGEPDLLGIVRPLVRMVKELARLRRQDAADQRDGATSAAGGEGSAAARPAALHRPAGRLRFPARSRRPASSIPRKWTPISRSCAPPLPNCSGPTRTCWRRSSG